MTITDEETYSQMAIDLARTDLLTAAQDLFAARPDLIELTIERRGDGIAWLLMDGRRWALPKGVDRDQ
jgi:hypothetical protein